MLSHAGNGWGLQSYLKHQLTSTRKEWHMVNAIEDERRKDDRHYCWGDCSCLLTLEGCRSTACAVPPSQEFNITDRQRYASELFNSALSPLWDPPTSGMVASSATVCCRTARYKCLTWDVYSSPCL